MKRRYPKLFHLSCSMLLLASLLVGCSGGTTPTQKTSNETTAPNTNTASDAQFSWEKDTSPFKFEQYFYASWGTFYPWRGSLVEKYITEATGVTPDIIIPSGDEKEYLNVMIAANDLPDVLVLDWKQPEVKKLIDAGKIYSINELAEQYAPELMDMIPEEVKAYHSQPDGKLYYLPSFFTTKADYENAIEKHNARPLFIQKGIYEGLGSPAINTPEDLLQLLKDIKAKYPDVKPFAIEPPVDVNQWGMVGSYTLQFFEGIFAPETNGHENFYIDNDKVQLVCENPNYVKAVKFLNTIYREGLISVDSMMMRHENFGETTDSAQYAVTGSYPIDIWKQHNPKIMALTNDESKTYIPLPYFKYDGKEPQFYGGRGAGWVGAMVTKNAKNPERIIRYLEYSWSDQGQITNLFGKEGETFEMTDGVAKYKPDILAELNADAAGFAEKYGFEQRLVMWRSKWAGMQKLAIAPQAYTDYVKEVGKYGVDIWDLGLDGLEPDPTSKEGVDYAKIKYIWNKYLAQMVIAKTDEEFDTAYEEGMKEMKAAGLENLDAYFTQKHLEDVAKKTGTIFKSKE